MSRLLFGLAGALLVLVAVGGALLALMRDPAIGVGTDVGVNPAAHVEAHNSPSVARNPTNPDNVVVAERLDRPEFSAAVHWSIDGGQVWGTTSLPLPEGLDRPYAPDVAFDDDGTLYVTYVNLVGEGNLPETLWLARSDDGGRTLSAPTDVAHDLVFQGRVVVDGDGTLHITYLDAEDVALLALPGGASIMAVHSTDEGRSFSEPVQVSDPGRERVGAALPSVDPSSGDLLVVYTDFKDNIRDFQNLEGPPWDEPFELVATGSTDGGESFRDGVVIDDQLFATKRFLPFLPEFPGVAVADDGTAYTTWADGRLGDSDVFLSRSDDGGGSWSEPARVNDNDEDDGTWQYLPAVSVSPSGRVDVLFHDRRRDPDNVMTDAFVATSLDGEPPFANERVSDESFDSRVGPTAGPNLEPDMGSQLGIDSLDEEALAVWTDTRLGDEATGRQDIVAARLAMPQPGGFNPAWLLPLGLLAAIMLAVAGLRMRRDEEHKSEPEPDRREYEAAEQDA